MHQFYLYKICALEVLFNDDKDFDGCFIVSDNYFVMFLVISSFPFYFYNFPLIVGTQMVKEKSKIFRS